MVSVVNPTKLGSPPLELDDSDEYMNTSPSLEEETSNLTTVIGSRPDSILLLQILIQN